MPAPKPKMSRRRQLARLAVLGALTGVAWLLVSCLAVRFLMKRTGAGPGTPEPEPAVAWGHATAFRLPTADGQELGAWFFDGRPDRPVVLILHGSGQSRSRSLPEAEFAAAAGCSVLMITFRAHGDSTGDVNDFGYGGRHDVAAAVDWIGKHHPGRPVVAWGQSMGSAAALFAAGDLGDRVAGYILECPYQDLHTATRNRTRMQLPPVLDYVAYMGLSTVSPVMVPDTDEISPLKAAARFPKSARALVMVGANDRNALPAEAAAIANAIGDRADLIVIKDAGHGLRSQSDPTVYRAAVMGMIEKCGRGGK